MPVHTQAIVCITGLMFLIETSMARFTPIWSTRISKTGFLQPPFAGTYFRVLGLHVYWLQR
jgi:hypothetical protein